MQAARYAASVFAGLGLQPIVMDEAGNATFLQSFIVPNRAETKAVNVVAYVRGTGASLRDEYVTVGAHLDGLGIRDGAIYNGANDNATGSAVVLELARHVAARPPRRSVLFALWGAEEIGMHGSRYFVAHPPIATGQMVAHVNFDGVGRYDRSPGTLVKIYALGGANICQALEDELLMANARSGQLEFDMEDREGWFKYSDHYNFHLAGVPSLFLTDLGSAGYHQPTDDVEFLDFEKLAKTAWTGLELLETLANRPTRICS